MATTTERKFVLQYFPAGFITVNVRLHPDEISKPMKFSQVKKAAGIALKLKPESLKIFGLFSGPLGYPQKLCARNDIVPPPGSISSLSFQRLSFDEDEERRITSKDERAMELIFWELKEQYDANLILPKPKLEQTEYLDRIMTLLCRAPFNQKRFVQTVRTFPLYCWSYYYRADTCTLQSKITAGSLCLEWKSQFHVVINLEKLIFLDISGEHELASWPWHCLRCVKMQRTPQPLIKFEVLITDIDDIVPLRLIPIETEQNTYLYSIIIHILKIHKSHFLHKHRSFPVSQSIAVAELVTGNKVYQYLNKCFHDPASASEEQEIEETPVKEIIGATQD